MHEPYFFPVGIVLPHLLEWIRSHFPQADAQARRILEDSPERPEDHQEYWEAVTRFLMQVHAMDKATQVL